MSWINDGGDHEGWVARILDDGREAHGSTSRRRDDGSVEFLELAPPVGGRWPEREEQVSSDRVCRWVVACTCGWRGSSWERVTELHQASEVEGREWRPLGDVGDEPQHVEEIAHTEWRRHLEPHDASAAVSRAAAAVARNQELWPFLLDAEGPFTEVTPTAR
ncbi:hypothetical protein AB0F91_45940 [Amycolatopsis sp. NPDC023774]|uniref:hypothetical protein n=1 Tax=Amycolatopsis sp. NPDC023774 TaxID=3155015 RepID=UPI0033C91425